MKVATVVKHNMLYMLMLTFDFVFLWLVNHVTLSFTDFDLEMITSNCSHDAVDILDGDNYQAPSIGNVTLCVFVRVVRTPGHISGLLTMIQHAIYLTEL